MGHTAETMHLASIRAHHHELIAGLVALRPKKRASKVSWVFMAGCAYFLLALIGDASVREALLSPKGEARLPQYAAWTAPRRAPAALPSQLVTTPRVAMPAVVAVATPIAPPSDPALQVAHHTAKAKRAHSKHSK